MTVVAVSAVAVAGWAAAVSALAVRVTVKIFVAASAVAAVGVDTVVPFFFFVVAVKTFAMFISAASIEAVRNVVDPDPYSGAFWIRIRNTDPDPQM